MSFSEYLRKFVNDQLAAADEEIFGVFQQKIVEYEEVIDSQRELLGLKLNTSELPKQDVQEEEEAVICDQERGSTLAQEPSTTRLPIKEENDGFLISQKGRASCSEARD